MLTLHEAKKAFDAQDESQLFIRLKNLDIDLIYTFQLVSVDMAIGYSVLTEGEEDKYVFVPMSIPSIPSYNAKEIVDRIVKKNAIRSRAVYTRLVMAVFSSIHGSQKVLELSGASIKKVLDLLALSSNPLGVKFKISKSGTTPPSYTVSADREEFDGKTPKIYESLPMSKDLHLDNLFFGVSVFDPPRKIEDFVELIK